MTSPHRLQVLGAGVISLILTLGIARFAYTPLLPIMQQQAGLGIAEGGWLAAINYMGYLCGALTAALINDLHLKDRLYRIGLVVAVITTGGMGLTNDPWLWAALRFFAGLSSAAGLLLGSGLILNWLIRHGHRSELGLHFSGVGLGIAFAAFAVELMNHYLDWREQWFVLTLLGLVLLMPAWRWLPPPDRTLFTNSGTKLEDSPPGRTYMQLFMAAYFCAGVGYVISATFIVAILEQQPALNGWGSRVFLVIGLTAAPACIVWDLIARRFGDINALLMAFSLQILGVLLPAINDSLGIALISAMLYGGTFIGIVSLVLTISGRYYPTRPAKMMGKMTLAYGVAQIAAPAITGHMAASSGSYEDGLLMAAAVMALGTLLIVLLKLYGRKAQQKNPSAGISPVG
jgi:predicted MFS family arabinose efflux permease